MSGLQVSLAVWESVCMCMLCVYCRAVWPGPPGGAGAGQHRGLCGHCGSPQVSLPGTTRTTHTMVTSHKLITITFFKMFILYQTIWLNELQILIWFCWSMSRKEVVSTYEFSDFCCQKLPCLKLHWTMLCRYSHCVEYWSHQDTLALLNVSWHTRHMKILTLCLEYCYQYVLLNISQSLRGMWKNFHNCIYIYKPSLLCVV